MNKDKTILSLCSGTGSWEKPYVEAGYNVIPITLPENDVRTYIPHSKIYGILAAPPCDHFAVSGARWWKEKGVGKLLHGLAVVDACMRIILISQPVFWCLENPVGRLIHYIGKPVMYFNPCDFGDPYTKKTCLWGKFNIPVKTVVDPVAGSKMHLLPPTENRKLLRSITPQGFANAFFKSNQ